MKVSAAVCIESVMFQCLTKSQLLEALFSLVYTLVKLTYLSNFTRC